MIKKKYIDKQVNKLKAIINNNICNDCIDESLYLISMVCSILYTSNLCLYDQELEDAIKKIAKKLNLNHFNSVQDYEANINNVIFIDMVGYDKRGLAEIYLNALCQSKNVLYVTLDKFNDKIPSLLSIINKHHAQSVFIDTSSSKVEILYEINKYIKNFRPGHIFLYNFEQDATCLPILYAYENYIIRYKINMGDHMFWLGAGCIDKCIDYRQYGANVSLTYRHLSEKKITIIPFYPNIDKNVKFKGFPFKIKDNQMVFFSGGNTYKTISKDNLYYSIVNKILENHKNLIFWYAGNINNVYGKKLIALKKLYPNRVFLTEERDDLFQILQNCVFMFSTYPIAGGLMYQFAAAAGKVPITFKYNDLTDGFLLNQNSLNVDFVDTESLYMEVDKLLSNKAYYKKRIKDMQDSIVKSDLFNKQVCSLLDVGFCNDIDIKKQKIDIGSTQKLYLDRFKLSWLDMLLTNRHMRKYIPQYFPLQFLKTLLLKIWKKTKLSKYYYMCW